jgi:hypothetical protein
MAAVYRVCSEKHSMKKALLHNILLDQYKQTTRGQSQFKAEARRALLSQMVAVSKTVVAKDQGISTEMLQVILEHFLACKEEAELEHTFRDVNLLLNLVPKEQRIPMLVKLLEKAPKAAFPHQVQVVLEQVQSNSAINAFKKIDAAIGEQL